MTQPLTETTAPAEASSARASQIVLICVAVALYWSSLYLYVPTLPVYAENIIGDLGLVGSVLGMYGLWQAVVRLPLGIAADWIGRRKPFIILGFVLAGAGAALMASATGYGGLALGRAVTGLSAAAWVPLTVLFSSLFPPKEAVRATSLLTLINSASRVLSTGVTGWLNTLGGYALAFHLAVGVSLMAIVATLPVRETARAPKRPSLRGIGILITRRDVLFPALLSAVGQYIAWATTFGFLPILAKNLGASGFENSMLVSLNLLVGIVGNLVLTAVVRRTGVKPILYSSYVIMALGVIAAAAAQSLTIVFLAQVLIGLGSGIAYPLCMGMSIQHVDEAERTTAMGLHQAVYAIGMFAGPWLSGILADAIDIQPMFWVTAGATFVLSMLLARTLDGKK